jgi:hypothetical protein
MESPLSGRRLWRIAGAIRDRIQAQKALRYHNLRHQIDNLVLELEELGQIRRKLGLCLERGWLGAAQGLVPEAHRLIRAVPYTCTDAERVVSAPNPDIPAIREVLAELHQVEEEFDEVCYHPEDDVLAVVTESIELEGVYLGKFEIRLRIEAIGERCLRAPEADNDGNRRRAQEDGVSV